MSEYYHLLSILSLKKCNIAQKKNLIAWRLALSTRLDLTSARLDFVSARLDFLLRRAQHKLLTADDFFWILCWNITAGRLSAVGKPARYMQLQYVAAYFFPCTSLETESFLRPLARRMASTRRPFLVDMRWRKPCLLLRFLLWGWNVLFIFVCLFSVVCSNCGCEVKHFFVNGRYWKAKNVALCDFFVERCCFWLPIGGVVIYFL